MDARHVEMLAGMADRMNLVGMSEDAGFAVADDSPILPAALPQLVANLEIFLGKIVAIVMFRLGRLADIECAAVEIGGDDIPADASLSQVVERRDAAGESVGMLEGERRGQAEARCSVS